MSDKETAPWIKKAAEELVEANADRGRTYDNSPNVRETAEIIAKHVAECTAPAPQPDAEKIRLLLIRAVMEMSYMHCAEVLSLVRSSEGESIIEEGMKLLGLKDLSEEELARVRAATPQVTPTPDQFPSRSQEKRIRTMRGDKNPLDPKASPPPEKCPTCGSNQQSSFWRGCREKSTIPDSWHSSNGEVERG